MNKNINVFDFSKRFRQCREAQKITRKDYCEMVSISKRYLDEIERGNCVPKFDTLVKMANALEVSLDYLFQESLIVGYKEKACKLQGSLDNLRPMDREHVLSAIEALISSYE